jgi:hypothetical protein
MKIRKLFIIPLLLALFAIGGCSASAGGNSRGGGGSITVG